MADCQEPGPSTSSGAGPSSSQGGPIKPTDDKRAERMKRLRDLHMKRNEATRLNHQKVVEEYQRSKLPVNWDKKKQWTEIKLQEEERRMAAEKEGIDYDQEKLLDIQADDAERWERKRQAKKHTDPGFSDYEAATARQYDRLTKNLKPDLEEYLEKKEELGEDLFYAGRNTVIHGTRKDSKEAIDRMVEDLEKQIDKRSKYSRRRRFDADADIDYINERNMKFNKKLERFYGQYTTEIKRNLERGTAI